MEIMNFVDEFFLNFQLILKCDFCLKKVLKMEEKQDLLQIFF